MSIVTSDLSKFGFREIRIMKDILNAYVKNPYVVEGSDLTISMNTYSGYVFLSDEDYNTYMLNGDELELFVMCEECNAEDFISELKTCDLEEEWEGVCCECLEVDN